MWYQVRRGDTLSGISRRMYGDSTDWVDIYAANYGRIYNPNLIHTGQWIYIPA